MPKLPQIKPRDIEKVLIKYGFSSRTTKSGHVVFTHTDGRRTVVPGHNRSVRTETLRAILRQADISFDRLLETL